MREAEVHANRLAARRARTCCSTRTTRSTGGSGATRPSRRRGERDVPVLVSVGYAACHWCHVMAHESFEDDATAAADERALRLREGRPRGAPGRRRGLHGGDAGDDRARRLADDRVRDAGRPSRSTAAPTSRRDRPRACPRFRQVLAAIARGLARPARRGRAAARRGSSSASCRGRATVSRLRCAADARRGGRQRWPAPTTPARGGFGGAPKFPPSMVLELLLRHHARTGDARSLAMVARHPGGDGPRRHLRPAGRRLRPVLRGRRWVVPHFEKMLYDNALLLASTCTCGG